ncbi:MAG TPA: glycine--tRNA ligase, partial [Thermoplasmata archaeon]|nr:glycine--tRNA ligase [Thermoplasmata archaeon]
MRPVSEKVMALARRRGFLWPSFEVHGKVAGLYDYGPAGTAMKRNVLEVWRRHFVVADGLLEIDTPTITPYEVFEASGHVEKFADLMGRCGSCGAYFKVEGLLGDLSGPEGASWEETTAALADVPCPDCGSTEWSVSEFNLMFSTTIGPDGGRRGFLRPETAQGIFVNFAPLYRLARERMPFGVAQIGRGYRNEISPRQGPIRLREFNMAEIEFFTDPEVGEFPPAERCYDRTLRLVPAGGGERTMTAWEAYTAGIIRSQYLMYFMARTASFLERVGIDHGRMRFRQHEPDEMAHYATDCWDAEVETSYGWIEVVGIADRSAYDLRAHMDHTGRDLTAMRRLPEPVETRVTAVVPVMQELGRRFRADART